MSGAVCELQLRAAGAFDVSVHTRYRPLCLQKPQTSGLHHVEGGVSAWPQEAGIWGHPYVLSSGWLFVNDIALTADWIVCTTLFFFFL